MENQFCITVVQRVPKTEAELDKVREEFRYHPHQHCEPVREFNERDVLSTVLSEKEFKVVRAAVWESWSNLEGE